MQKFREPVKAFMGLVSSFTQWRIQDFVKQQSVSLLFPFPFLPFLSFLFLPPCLFSYSARFLPFLYRRSKVRAPSSRGSGGITPENFWNLVCDLVHSGAFWRRICGCPVSTFVKKIFVVSAEGGMAARSGLFVKYVTGVTSYFAL